MMKQLQTPAHLRLQILQAILQEERRRARWYLLSAVGLGLCSVATLVFSVLYILQGVEQSGFYQYLRLLTSDTDVILAYWREFTLSLVEAAPVVGLSVLFAGLFGLLSSVRVFTRHARYGFSAVFNS